MALGPMPYFGLPGAGGRYFWAWFCFHMLSVLSLCLFLVLPILIAGSVSFTADQSMSFPPTGFSLR
jgi:ABC-type spermidine/putrescine transport system permease subunit II